MTGMGPGMTGAGWTGPGGAGQGKKRVAVVAPRRGEGMEKLRNFGMRYEDCVR